MRVRNHFRVEPRQDRYLKRLALIAQGPATPGKWRTRDDIHER